MSSSEEGCCICYDDVCLYKHSGSNIWHDSAYCWACIKHMLDSRFQDYIDTVEESRCKKTVNAAIEAGPPIWIEDKGLPVPDGEHVAEIQTPEGDVHSAVYTGAVQGEARYQLWEELRKRVEARRALLPDQDSVDEEAP